MKYNVKSSVFRLLTASRWALGASFLSVIVACDGNSHGSSEVAVGESSQMIMSASSQAVVIASSSLFSSSVSSVAESSSSVANYQFSEISIEDKGLAVLDDTQLLIVGAIHGNSIRADNLWTYTGDARLLALTATTDSTIILATFDNAVVMLNRFTGEKLG